MKRALIGAIAGALITVAPAGSAGRAVLVAGVSVHVPAGWYAAAAPTPTCDPMRLIAVSSAPLRPYEAHRGFALPRHSGQVLVFVLELRVRETARSAIFGDPRTSPLTGTTCGDSSRAANHRQLLRISAT